MKKEIKIKIAKAIRNNNYVCSKVADLNCDNCCLNSATCGSCNANLHDGFIKRIKAISQILGDDKIYTNKKQPTINTFRENLICSMMANSEICNGLPDDNFVNTIIEQADTIIKAIGGNNE